MPPFAVLHVCMGNTCRSPMAERLLALRVAQQVGRSAEDLVLSSSCAIGSWHVGQGMNTPAAHELRSRGGSADGFRSRHMATEHIETADLILTATGEQVEYIANEHPQGLARTFLVRHFGAIAARVTDDELPAGDGSARAVYERGRALVALADKRRDTVVAERLEDPWGEAPEFFTRVADEIDVALEPLVARLFGTGSVSEVVSR
ncbi:protein-tyrosine phosphatase [Stackebrandtia endophytica]|uniref:Protein-tyrosine phosphatase n=1 Tax=Stackebrandtia endophytica TaxID=1496996 RepID=A0A543B0B8_9ACTN|nr:phosphotyrosine protein phosphatase [Stackebrandtia endophytica]TQL78273.1 protein-tyrosine phosphatase [Stackebrandtia endophytica]